MSDGKPTLRAGTIKRVFFKQPYGEEINVGKDAVIELRDYLIDYGESIARLAVGAVENRNQKTVQLKDIEFALNSIKV